MDLILQMATEVEKSMEASSLAQDKVLQEKLVWPHRSWSYFQRATKSGSTLDPEEWFKGLNCAAVQDEADPDRNLAASIDRDKLTVFFFWAPNSHGSGFG